MPTKWKETGDNSYERKYGPVIVRVRQEWVNTPRPEKYHAYISCNGICNEWDIMIASTGLAYYDEKIGSVICRLVDKEAKRIIREWLK